jgi:hypothetical protein
MGLVVSDDNAARLKLTFDSQVPSAGALLRPPTTQLQYLVDAHSISSFKQPAEPLTSK